MEFYSDTDFERSGDFIEDQITLFRRQIARMERERQELLDGIISRRDNVARLQAALAHPGIKPSDLPKGMNAITGTHSAKKCHQSGI
jgi:hypothetical protein